VLKPVRHSELLDWLERQLGLQWLDAAVPPPAAPASEPLPPSVWPTPGRLAALQDVVQLGYYRGIMNQLDQIEAEEPATAALVAQWREHARRFQFEAIGRQP
jgi:hypothetical protein